MSIFLLLEKHITERRCYITQTIIEVFLGIFLFWFVLLIREFTIVNYRQVRVKWEDNLNENNASTRTNHNSDRKIVQTSINYFPHNDLSDGFMNEVTNRLDDSLQISIDNSMRDRGIQTSIHDSIAVSPSHNKLFIKFEDFEGDKVPIPFSYTITYKTFKNYRDFPRYLARKIMRLQWEIDKVYMERVSKEKIDIEPQMIPSGHMTSSVDALMLQMFMVYCSTIAPIPAYLYNSAKLVKLKKTCLRELMRISGVGRVSLYFSHLLEYIIIGDLYCFVFVILLRLTVVKYSSNFLMAISLGLHFLTSMSLSFITNTLTQEYHYSDSLAVLFYIFLMLANIVWSSFRPATITAASYIMCVWLPHEPIFSFWATLTDLENRAIGIKINNMYQSTTEGCLPVVQIWGFYILQITIIMCLGLVLDCVKPGKYGLTPFCRCLGLRSILRKNKTNVSSHNIHTKPKNYVEGPSLGINQVKFRVDRVSKVFSDGTQALRGVTFNVYKGDIMALVGPNGAGKTTLISIVTGLYNTSFGEVYFNNVNIRKRSLKPGELALCPQADVTFSYLTVKENIIFFGRIAQARKVEELARTLIQNLNLKFNKSSYPYQLSSGCLRALQVACTLCSDADTLVLDEPSSNMDLATRQALWDVLLMYRGQKTILLATSLMDEADALGDRILILSEGIVKCFGSPAFLKKTVGAGYDVSLFLGSHTYATTVRQLVETYVPDVTCRVLEDKRMMLRLPLSHREHFPALFDRLVSSREELGISNIDLGLTMEEIFLEFVKHEETNAKTESDKLSEWRLPMGRAQPSFFKSLKCLLERNFGKYWTKKWHFFILRILIPTVSVMIITCSHNASPHAWLKFWPAGAAFLQHSVPPLQYAAGPLHSRGLLPMLQHHHPELQVQPLPPQDALNLNRNLEELNKNSLIILMDPHNPKLVYPRNDEKLSYKAVNIFSNLVMALNMPDFYNPGIQTTVERMDRLDVQPKTIYLCADWAMWVACLSIVPMTSFIFAPINDRNSFLRHIHIMTGCSPFVHWLAMWLVHMTLYIAIIPFNVPLILLIFERDKTFDETDFLVAFIILYIAFGAAFFMFIYVLSFILYKEKASSHIYIATLAFEAEDNLTRVKEEVVSPEEPVITVKIESLDQPDPTSTMSLSQRKRVSLRQIELLVEYLEAHRDLACGRLKSKEGSALSSRLWAECAKLLNAELDGDQRSPKLWSKWYTDYKCRLLSRIRQNRQTQKGTGGIPLGALEGRIVALLSADTEVVGKSGTTQREVQINPLLSSPSSARPPTPVPASASPSPALPASPHFNEASDVNAPTNTLHDDDLDLLNNDAGNESPEAVPTTSAKRGTTRRRRYKQSHRSSSLEEAQNMLASIEKSRIDAELLVASALNKMADAVGRMADAQGQIAKSLEMINKTLRLRNDKP